MKCSIPGCALFVPKKPIRGHKLTHLCREHFAYGARNPFQEFPKQEKIITNVWTCDNFSASLKQQYNFDKKGVVLE